MDKVYDWKASLRSEILTEDAKKWCKERILWEKSEGWEIAINVLKENRLMWRRFHGFWGHFKVAAFLWKKGIYGLQSSEPKNIEGGTQLPQSDEPEEESDDATVELDIEESCNNVLDEDFQLQI